MTTKLKPRFFLLMLPLVLAGSLLLNACAPAVVISNPTALPEPTSAPQPSATLAPSETVLAAPAGVPNVAMDASGLASGILIETIPANTDANNAPYWDILPEYTRLSLQGYPLSGTLLQPQIFVYPLQDLAKTNEGAAGIISSLQTYLKSPGEVKDMPFMPLYNAAQMMHAQVQALDFKSGRGVCFLTEFSQGIIPINNHDLIYTFQGLTSDGKYYVAAVLPVNHPGIPANDQATGNLPSDFTDNYQAYTAGVAAYLNTQAANLFSPDLARLDAMISSIEIK